ncbi:hypothetical protein BN1723_010688 [Verticillium longisporum]|uniref:Peptide hydrolase n=1 Tax=Verticillium longisporum TaxID=100787 RepID=A0A0G4L191_VERLO|nr:hypothetical protein BN1723_010688 [Verticillium longisporum]
MVRTLHLTGLAAALGSASILGALAQGIDQTPMVDEPEHTVVKLVLSGDRSAIDSEALQKLIKGDNLFERAKQLYEIAKLGEAEYNHPTRVIGSEGHLGTLDYIYSTISQLGDYYTLSNQSFPAVTGNVFESRLVLGNKVPESASPMSLTPATKNKEPVHGDLVLVQHEGCDESDYPEEVRGNIAFVLRGTCPFGTKSANAGKAGAVAAVIYNYEKETVHGTLGTPSPDHVATFGLGLSLLEIATQLTNFDVNNCVRFAWWAGEEEGLLGSDYYVSVLPDDENEKIRLFMDYDMLGSPNYAYQIYNATNAVNPTGSEELRDLYVDWYKAHDLNYTFIPFDGRSDYDGFIRNGIPGGGIATGAEGVKTKREQEQFGGKAGDWYDPCYHQLCDDLHNVDVEAWELNTKLVAHSVAVFAKSFDGFPKRTLKDVASSEYAEKTLYHGSKLVL